MSDAARTAVQEAVEALGYVPNRAARSLVTRRTDTVALVVSEPGDRVFGEPYFGAIVRGVGARLSASPFQLLLMMCDTDRDRERVTAYLTEQHVDGVLLLSLHARDDLLTSLDARGVPTVCGGAVVGSDPACVVDADNRAGGRVAVEHLLGVGRRRLARAHRSPGHVVGPRPPRRRARRRGRGGPRPRRHRRRVRRLQRGQR